MILLDKTLIIYPVFVMVVLTFFIMIQMRLVCNKNIKNKKIGIKYFKVYAEDAPEEVEQARQHFKNCFEIPVLFYVLSLFIYMTDNLHIFNLVFAWLFIFFKIVHSYIRMTSNNVIYRARAFILSLIFLLLGWIYFIITI